MQVFGGKDSGSGEHLKVQLLSDWHGDAYLVGRSVQMHRILIKNKNKIKNVSYGVFQIK